jgi:hypothetical protein
MATTYCTTAQLKSVAGIKTTQTGDDTWINTLRDQAYDEINMRLRDYISVPLTAAAEDYDVIVRVESFLGAGLYRFTKDVPKEGVPSVGKELMREARETLQIYIDEHFLKSKSSISGGREPVHQSSSKFWES